MPPKRLRPSELINRLQKRITGSADELRDRLKTAQQAVAAKIEALADRQAAAGDARARNALYADITSIYDVQAEGFDQWMLDQVEQTAIDWSGQAKRDLKTMGGKPLVKFDRKLVERYWELIHGSNQKYLAGVFTDKMAASDLRHLRSAFLDTFRQQSIEGWTTRETQKALQSKWDEMAKNLRSYRFVDSAGRAWDNADYINMLTRTTLQKVHRESYVDGIVQEGYELARIVGDGDPCEICAAWDGVIVDLTGKPDSDYPTLSEAYDGGFGHPNCGCRVEAIIPAVDGAEIKRQAKQPGVDWEDPEAVQEYNDEIRLQEKRDDGMPADEAERDLKRDKLKRSLEVSFLGQHVEEIEKIPPAVLDRIPMDKLPRFELAKKGDLDAGAVASNRKSILGGVIKVDRNSQASDEVGRHIRLTFAKTVLDGIGTVDDYKGRSVLFSSRIVQHWDAANNRKTSADLDGRLSHLSQLVASIGDPYDIRIVGQKRFYLSTWQDGEKAKYGCVIAGSTGTVETILYSSKKRNWKKWSTEGEKE